ncbi:hypothetical protein EAF00_007170 [Botryotinia globosa]|nr:hypothetical protein EAF00_007170 [Botryotinia globosa]
MANPKTPQQNPRIPFEQKVFSEPSFPTSPTARPRPRPRPRPLKTSPNSTLHNPPPQLSSSSSSAQFSASSSSYSSAPSSPSPPSNLTSKMRNLWNTSHSKSFLSNLNMGLAANFPLKNLNLHSKKNVPIVCADAGLEIGAGFGRDEYHEYIIHANHANDFDHANQMNERPAAIPIPKLSSPNGKSAKPLTYCATGDLHTNLLSGPSTQHAEYLISRVEGRFMSPDTPPMDLPLGERFGRGLLFGFGSGSERYGDESIKGTYENGNEIAGVGDMRSTGDRNQEGVKSRSGRGTGKMIPKKQNQKTWKSIHRSCREMLDGMHLSKCDGEGTKATGQENGNRFVGAESYMDIVNDEDDDEGNETEHDNTENYDECDVFTDAHSGPGSGKYWEKDQDGHRLIHTESQDSMVEIYTSSPRSSNRASQLESQNPANSETDMGETINESILTPRKPLRESDFAYMHMRPKPRTNPDPTTGNPPNAISEHGNENGNTYRYRYPNHNNEDDNEDDNEDAQSSLDMEDSLYDDTENPTPKFKVHMARAAAEYPDFATMMDRDRDMNRDMNTDTYPATPTPQTQIQNANSWSQPREFDADAALEASLSSLSRLQYEYQLQYLSGSQGSIVA